MLRRLTLPLVLVSLVATACGGRDIVVRPADESDDAFTIQVADAESDAGLGLSLATDAQGNPHLSYLVLAEEAEAGAEAAAAVPGAPVLPAVMHAHLSAGAWTRSVVADSSIPDAAEGEDAPTEPLFTLSETDLTAIAVDAEGVHHVVWTTEDALFYTSNAGGSFGVPQQVEEGQVAGISIAADPDGAPWIAFYDMDVAPDGEGPGAVVRVATLDGEKWKLETAAEASPADPISSAIGVTEDGAVIAYGSEGQTFLARQSGQTWDSETADEEGGYGVSMSIADGNPHLAYLNFEGQVRHAHSIAGGKWETSEVAPDGDYASPTSIAVDGEGVHHVAWESGGGVLYATNAEGDFAQVPIDGATGATSPKVAAGAAGVVNLAWRDTIQKAVILASRGGPEPLLAAPLITPGAGGGNGGQPPPDCAPEGTELTISASGSKFDTNCLAAPAGEAFTIAFDNTDALSHNVAIYSVPPPQGQALFNGELFAGPDTRNYQVEPLEAGTLHFQCDAHPTTMTGTFVVA